VVRIHPEDDGSYTIPQGNFGEYYAEYFDSLSQPQLAANYRDTSLVHPELYAKGFRNAYTIDYDPLTDWVLVSDCGSECDNYNGYDPSQPWCPDSAKGEEHNLMKIPGFYGWPYFHGLNHPYAQSDELKKDPNAPRNESPYNTGVTTLPPAIPGTHVYDQQCAMVGPIYRYDSLLQSEVKLPPHFEGKWFVTDFNNPPGGSWIKLVSLDSAGENTGVSSPLFTHIQNQSGFYKPVHFRQGPDGALYMINYSSSVWFNSDMTTSIGRIIYTGDCHPQPAEVVKNHPEAAINLNKEILSIRVNGPHTISIYNTRGALIRSIKGMGHKEYSMSDIHALGIYIIQVKTDVSSHKQIYLNSDFRRMAK
jgi:hypothetical protein